MVCIYIVGLGPGGPEYLTVKAWHLLQSVRPLFLKTQKHPVAKLLQQKGIKFCSFDSMFSQQENAEAICRRICDVITSAARREGQAVYAVPGHPCIGELSIRELCRSREVKVEVVPGLSLLEASVAALQINGADGLLIIDAAELKALEDAYRYHLLITQFVTHTLASQVKLKLMEVYPGDHQVGVIDSRVKVEWMPISGLDRLSGAAHHFAVYVPPLARYSLGQMADVMRRLRQECPWDREQDHRSLRSYVLEEAYEVVNAINEGGIAELKEELGDLLLQVVFHSQIARENGNFGMPEIINGITSKILHRHPHVFGQLEVKDSAEVAKNWQKIKQEEKGYKDSFNVAAALPPLVKAKKIQNRAAEVGFDWPDVEGVADKVKEEVEELIYAYKQGEKVKIEEEIGDLLFSIVNLSRFLKVDPEVALSATIEKFIARFRYIEKQAAEREKDVSDYSLKILDKWWEEAKNKENREKIAKERRNYIE